MNPPLEVVEVPPSAPQRIVRGLVPPSLRGYQRKWLRADILAGIALAAVAIPEGMGYSSIAQVPTSAGMYAMVIPAIVFALIGSSRLMVVGADSATAALIASGIGGLAIAGLEPATDEWLEWAALIAVVTGLMLVLARILKLGFLGDFLSTAVLVGFLAGVGVLVITKQLPHMMGRETREGQVLIGKWIEAVVPSADVNYWDLGFALVTLALLIGAKLAPFKMPVPMAVVVVIVSIGVVMGFDLAKEEGSHKGGVTVEAGFSAGLPALELPGKEFLVKAPLVLTISFGCLLVILAQSAATARSFAQKTGDSVDVNRDLSGLCAANLAAGLTGTIVANSSPTRTAVVEGEKARSQLANIVCALIVLAAILLLQTPLSYLPVPVIAAIVFMVGLHLIKPSAFRKIWRVRPAEFGIALMTTLVVVFFGVLTGIIVAMIVSLGQIIHRQYRPNGFLIGVGHGGSRVFVTPRTGFQTMPGLVVFRYDADLFYANVGRFSDDVMRLMDGAPDAVKWMVLDCSAISDVDYSAAEELERLINFVHSKGAHFVLAGVSPELFASMRTARVMGEISPDHVFPTVSETIRTYRKRNKLTKMGLPKEPKPPERRYREPADKLPKAPLKEHVILAAPEVDAESDTVVVAKPGAPSDTVVAETSDAAPDTIVGVTPDAAADPAVVAKPAEPSGGEAAAGDGSGGNGVGGDDVGTEGKQ